MDVHALAQTPVFLFSIVVTGIVAAYSFAMLFRFILSGFSVAASSSGLPPEELLALDLAGKYQGQLTVLQQRVDALSNLSQHLAEPFQDQSWSKLLATCDTLQELQQELYTLIRTRDFTESTHFAQFLIGRKRSSSELHRPLGETELALVVQWQSKTTALVQRMVAKIEDAAIGGTGSDGHPLPEEFFKTLSRLRNSIIRDEQHFR